MFLRSHGRKKDGKDHTYWSLVETVRTADGPRQKTLCYPGELNSSAHARWLTTVEVFKEQGEAQQLKLFPSHVQPPPDDPQVARVLLNTVRLERTRQFGARWLGLEMWKRLELEVLILGQHEDERSSRLFDSDCDRLSAKPHRQFSGPDVNRLRSVVDRAGLHLRCPGLRRPRMSRRPSRWRRVRQIRVGIIFLARERLAGRLCLREGLIVESFQPNCRRHLSIRFRSKVHSAARSSILEHQVSGNAIGGGEVPAVVQADIRLSHGQQRDFHNARPRRLGKTYSQHLSFGATIRATQECECAGINRHVVGDERALQKRSSDSIRIVEGTIRDRRRNREPQRNAAWSKALCTSRNNMHENRKTCSASVSQTDRSAKAQSRTEDAYALQESDRCVVPMKLPNTEEKSSTEVVEGRQRPKENGELNPKTETRS